VQCVPLGRTGVTELLERGGGARPVPAAVRWWNRYALLVRVQRKPFRDDLGSRILHPPSG